MTTPESPVTPGSDAVLREWLEVLYAGDESSHPEILRSLCEAVAVAERLRCIRTAEEFAFIKPREHEWSRYIGRRIADLTGLPISGRPGK